MPRLRFIVLVAIGTFCTGVAWAQKRMVDTDGGIDLAGAVVVPSRWAVLLLFLAMVLLSAVGALLAQRSQERREAKETRRNFEARLAAQEEELTQLRSQLQGEPAKSSDPST